MYIHCRGSSDGFLSFVEANIRDIKTCLTVNASMTIWEGVIVSPAQVLVQVH